jgi:small subunit ribosomal protein S1
MNYGAFVEVLPGVEGLLHVSEVSNQKVRHPREVVKEGETVDVRIIELDPGRKRLSLSMRSPDAERETGQSELDVGTSITGTVSSIKPYGVFVRIVEPVTGVDGLLPIEETGLPRGTDLSQKFPAGSEVRAEVLRVDDRGRIRLTVRSAEERALDRERGARSSGEGASEGGRDGRRAARQARREHAGAEPQEESKEGKPSTQGLGIMANAFKRVLGQR